MIESKRFKRPYHIFPEIAAIRVQYSSSTLTLSASAIGTLPSESIILKLSRWKNFRLLFRKHVQQPPWFLPPFQTLLKYPTM